MADKKPSNREQIKQIVAGIEDGIQQIFQSERYLEYLRTMSRFHTYSVNNTILIHMQMPNATRVAGFNKWKNQFGRHVKKGEKGLTVIAPTPFKKKIEEMKLDPETRAPVLDSEGKVVMEEREIEIPMFKPVKVFDVSQTEGRPLPSLVTDLTGNVQHYEAFMEALRRTSPMPIYMEPLRPGLDGLCNFTKQTITIREGMSQVQTVCASVHEITHATLHNKEHTRLTAAAGDEAKEPPKPKDENTMEVEAESVSYTVCQYYGIETGANSLGYIATWSKDRSLPELKASLETISKTANALITSIDRHFAEICKERGIDLTAQQPEQAEMEASAQEMPPVPELTDTPEQFMDDMLDLMDRLYAAGQIDKNFPPDGREEIKAEQVRILRVNPALARAVLEKFVREDTGAAEAKVLLRRLDKLTRQQEQKYRYVVEYEDSIGQFLIAAYQKGSSKYGLALFTGSEAACNDLLEKLQTGTLRYGDFCTVIKACVSQYTTRDGAELVALTDENDKVYLGRRDHYDHRGHYLNDDHSLVHISDNEKIFNLISGEGFSIAQTDALAGRYYTKEDFSEYDSLRVGALAQFEQVKPLLFAGKPYQSAQPLIPEIPWTDQQEALYLLDDSVYLHIQASDEGWDYTLYTRHDMAQIDGGRLDEPDYAIADVVDYIRKTEEIGIFSIKPAPMELLNKLQDTAHAVQTAVEEIQSQRQNHMNELREHFAQEDAALWDTTLDEYPVPDAALTLDDLIEDSDLLPLSRERAAAFLEQDMTVYMVEAMKDPAMVFDQDDLMEQPEGVMFAVPREEWEESQDFRQAVADRLNHQEERERAFLNHAGDCFAIYQVIFDDERRFIAFSSLERLHSDGYTVDRSNYELAYTAPLPEAPNINAALETLWEKFNLHHPADYQRPSMSVSDIVAIKRGGVVSCHYCDSVGFAEIPDFIAKKPSVAELEAQVKAGQTISLMDLADAAHRESGQKKSVVAQLKNQPAQERKKTAPKKSAEKER